MHVMLSFHVTTRNMANSSTNSFSTVPHAQWFKGNNKKVCKREVEKE